MLRVASLRTAQQPPLQSSPTLPGGLAVAAFLLHPKHEQDGADDSKERLRLVHLDAPPRPRLTLDPRHTDHAERIARLRGETAPGAGVSLTLGFLVAGAIILSAIAFWSGPAGEAPEGGAQSSQGFVPGP